MIRFACPGCQAIYNVKDDKAGKTGRCPSCNSQFLIPGEPPTTPRSFLEQPASCNSQFLIPGEPAAPPPTPKATPTPQPVVVEIEPCPNCDARLTVEAEHLGIEIECPECNTAYLAVKTGSTPKSAPEPARKSSFSGKSGSSLAETLSGAGSKSGKSSAQNKPLRRDEPKDENEDQPYAVDDDDDGEEGERPVRRRKRKRSRRRASGNGNKATARVVSGVMSLISGALQMVCGGCLMIAGGFLLSAFSGRGPNAAAAPNPAGGFTLIFIAIGVGWIMMALLNIVAGVGALSRKPYGRILTMVVSALASVGAVLDLVCGGYALVNGVVLQVLISIVSFGFAVVHAVSGFVATVGEGSAEEFDQ